MDFDKARKLKKSLIPREGFNVVAVDDFALPDEALYFVAHSKSEEEANAKRDEKIKAGIKAFVYGPETE